MKTFFGLLAPAALYAMTPIDGAYAQAVPYWKAGWEVAPCVDLACYSEWSFVQAKDPTQAVPSLNGVFSGQQTIGSTTLSAHSGNNFAVFSTTQAAIDAGKPHSKVYKEWLFPTGSPKSDVFQRPLQPVSSSGVDGTYAAWFYIPSDYKYAGSGWTNIFQFKLTDQDPFSQDPTWWVNMRENPTVADLLMLHVENWAPGVNDPSKDVAAPKGQWFELRADLDESYGIDWYLNGSFWQSSSSQTWQVARSPNDKGTPQTFVFGVGHYGGVGWIAVDDVSFTPRAAGTSLSTPQAAKAASDVSDAHPYMTKNQVRQVLLSTAHTPGDPGVDPASGLGLLDLAKALRGPGRFDWGDFQAGIASGQGVWGNDITGSGGLVKAGAGTLILTGLSSYLGRTSVTDGVLTVNGAIASPTLIGPRGMLTGTGTVRGDVRNDGAVSSGSRGGTLTIVGNYTQSANAALVVMVGAPEGTSRVDVTGSASLAGTVDVLMPVGGYGGDKRYTVLSALGGTTGRLKEDDCGNCRAFLGVKLAYDPGTVYLDVARNAVTFADKARTANDAAAAGAVESLGVGKPLYDLAVSLNGTQASDLFAQVPGEINASTVTGLLEDSRFTRDAINDRLRAAFETVGSKPLPLMGYGDDAKETASAPSERYGAWGSAFGSWGSTDSDGNAAKLSRSTGGFVTGIDGLLTDDIRLGFLAGYSHSSFKVDDRRSSASSDNYHLGLYGGTQWGALSFRSGLTYSWSEIDSSRQVTFPGFTDSLSGSYRAGTTQAFGELGYSMKAGSFAFEPFANLAYVTVRTNGFTETGGGAALSVHGGSNDVTFTTLGIRASTDFELGSIKATARGMIGWRHGFGDVTPTIAQAFSGSNAFTIAGAPIARDSAVIEAGLDFAVTPQATLGLSYQGQLGSKARDHGFRADLSVKF